MIGSLVLSSVGVASANDVFDSAYPISDVGGGDSDLVSPPEIEFTPSEGENGNVEENPEQPAPESPDNSQSEIPPEEEIQVDMPEGPQFSDDTTDIPQDQVSPEEDVPTADATVTPTEAPVEDIKDVTFTFGECKYGSTITFMDSSDNVIATIRTEDGVSTVDYSGASTVDGSTVTLEDVNETDFHILSDNDMMGSDVSEFSVVCEDGSTVANNVYENPFWVISETFTLDQSATVHMSFVNNSFVPDEMLDKIDTQPELMEEEPVPYSLGYAVPEPKAIQGKADLTIGNEVFHYPWTSKCGTTEFFVSQGKKGEEGYWSARATCAQAHLLSPDMGKYDYADWYATSGMVHPTADSRRTIILLMLMLPGNTLDEVGKQVWNYDTREYLYSLCHGAISWINAGTLTPAAAAIGPDGTPVGLDDVIIAGIKEKYKKTMTAINKEICTLATTTYKDTVDKYNLYLLKCGDGTRQNVCFVRRKPAPKLGYITVKKTSANSSMTNGNGNYSLKGAVYGVYTDKACKNKVGSITTDASGNGKLSNLKLDTTYYVKETKASPGYKLDPNVYSAIPTAQ